MFINRTLRSLLVGTLDVAAGTVVAWMMWWNAGATTADLPGSALVVTIVAGASVFFVQSVLHQRADANREFLVVGTQILLIAAGFVTWAMTNRYVIGWFVAVVALVMIVTNVARLFVILLRRGQDADPAALEVPPLIGIFAGGAGVVSTVAVHGWSAHLLNVTVILIAIAFTVGAGVASLARTRQRHGLAPSKASLDRANSASPTGLRHGSASSPSGVSPIETADRA